MDEIVTSVEEVLFGFLMAPQPVENEPKTEHIVSSDEMSDELKDQLLRLGISF